MAYYVYIIQSEADGSYYIGYSVNPIARLADHNKGRSRYTSRKIPWKLVYTEEFDFKSQAILRERFLKKQRSHAFYEKLISNK